MYYCELNPFEMVWGRAKYYYRLNPPSTKEEDVERYATAALAAVTIYRYTRCSLRFMDAYHQGLNGKQAAWANKKYHGHRVLPDTIMKDLEEAGVH